MKKAAKRPAPLDAFLDAVAPGEDVAIGVDPFDPGWVVLRQGRRRVGVAASVARARGAALAASEYAHLKRIGAELLLYAAKAKD